MSLVNDNWLVILKLLNIKDCSSLLAINKQLLKLDNEELWQCQYNKINLDIIDGNYKGKCKKYYQLSILKKQLDYKWDIESFYQTNYLSMNYSRLPISLSFNILTNIETLYLDGNHYKEIPPIYDLYNLKLLSLGINKIEKIPKEICKLGKLEKLLLYNNRIKKIPKWLYKLKLLKYVSFNNNDIVCIPDTISRMKNLTNLDVSRNKIKFISEDILKMNILLTLDEL